MFFPHNRWTYLTLIKIICDGVRNMFLFFFILKMYLWSFLYIIFDLFTFSLIIIRFLCTMYFLLPLTFPPYTVKTSACWEWTWLRGMQTQGQSMNNDVTCSHWARAWAWCTRGREVKRFIQKTDEEAATAEWNERECEPGHLSSRSVGGRRGVWETGRTTRKWGSRARESRTCQGGAVIGNQANRHESPPDEASRQLERSRVASQTKQRGRLSLPWL